MKLVQLEENEYLEFLNLHPLKSFLQTPNYGKIKQYDGCEYYLLGLKKDDKIMCEALLISYEGKLPGKVFGCPRGFIIDFNNFELLELFTNEIKKFVKKEGGYLLNIEPKLLYKERDINGNIVKNGFNNEKIYNKLISLGYKHNGFYTELNPNKQVRWAFLLELDNKTEEEVFNNMSSKTKNHIRKAEKYGITTREIDITELDKFKDVVENSGQRKNFHARSLSYYEEMYKCFHEKNWIKYILAELHTDKYIAALEEEIEEEQKRKNNLPDTPSNRGKLKELNKNIESLNIRLEQVKRIQEEKGKTVVLSGSMFMLYGDEVVYLFSGNYGEYMFLGGQYLIQWNMIKYAIHNKFKKYNFYGIDGKFSKDDMRYGVYEFKKGFDGAVIEYIGDFDYIISKPTYMFKKALSTTLEKIRK